ncbi:anti-sigma factor family protein [Novipirellula sp. SH528]|uniref:anti-sigma factor family protein n=1 Tax=Novipirellula sp. SH528 TaxID=3454466 RepID=UPI003FA097E0
MHEDLLGYLLGALEPHEMDRVAQWLRESPEARRELAEIERALRPLEEHYQPPESPPADLISRTLANLPTLPKPGECFVAPVVSSDDDQVTLPAMNNGVDPSRQSQYTWLDWVGGALATAILLALLLPSIAEGRIESRKVACQDQLRQFGTALTQYVSRDHQNRLPAVAKEGPEAFAGVFMMRLNDAGLLADVSQRWCPSLGQPEVINTGLTQVDEFASVQSLHEVSVDQLREIQQYAGGHYAYTLGVVDGQQFKSPKFESRSSFAVMSDAPTSRFTGVDIQSQNVGHSGLGINVLYEDGRVQFMPLSSLNQIPDHPWLNHRDQVEAGVNIDDASLAPSHRPPFAEVRQR